MYCGNCGKEINRGDTFCGNCGHEVPINNVDSNPPKKTSGWLIALIILIPVLFIGICILAIFCFVMGIFTYLDEEADRDFVYLGSDSVPTISYVIDDKDLCGYSSDSEIFATNVAFTYCDGEISKQEYDEYIDELILGEGFIETDSHYYSTLVKEAYDGGVIMVNIDISDDVIEYVKKSYDYEDYYGDEFQTDKA